MHVIAEKTLHGYSDEYPEAASWLMTFLDRAEHADWRSIADVRRIYPHADATKAASGRDIIILNVCGNRYRLIVAIHFNRQKVYVLRFLTHGEYDKNLWRVQL